MDDEPEPEGLHLTDEHGNGAYFTRAQFEAMSDTNGRKPSRIIPLRDRQRPRAAMSAQEIKDEIIAGVAAGSLAMGQKVYEQVMENVTRMLAEMETRLRAEFSLGFDPFPGQTVRAAAADYEARVEAKIATIEALREAQAEAEAAPTDAEIALRDQLHWTTSPGQSAPTDSEGPE